MDESKVQIRLFDPADYQTPTPPSTGGTEVVVTFILGTIAMIVGIIAVLPIAAFFFLYYFFGFCFLIIGGGLGLKAVSNVISSVTGE